MDTTISLTPTMVRPRPGRKAARAGWLLVITSVPLGLVALMLAAIGAAGFSHEPPELSTGDSLILFAILAFPVVMAVLGLALIARCRWAVVPAAVVAGLGCFVWVFIPLLVPALVLLAGDAQARQL